MCTTSNVNIAIVTSNPFPSGMAATNRILSWSSVLAEQGFSVKIYIVRQTEREGKVLNHELSGIVKGVEFEYLHKTNIYPIHKNKLYKYYLNLYSDFKLVKILLRDRPSIAITYLNLKNISLKLILLVFRIFLKYKLVIEETEYPVIYKKASSSLYKKIYLFLYKFSDGMLVISNELYNYYSDIGAKNIFHLPMTVDFSRFVNQDDKLVNKEKYFIYVGGGGGFNRDGLFDILKAFHFFSLRNEDFVFLVVGQIDESSDLYKQMIDYITKNNLERKFIFLGSKPTHEIPDMLIKATGIVMAPPHNFVSGGFPTKLGEFLASSTPVITTKVSDIPLYLNNTNAYLVEPGDFLSISNAMDDIVTYPDLSISIGKQGRKVAEGFFSVYTYIELLKSFLRGL